MTLLVNVEGKRKRKRNVNESESEGGYLYSLHCTHLAYLLTDYGGMLKGKKVNLQVRQRAVTCIGYYTNSRERLNTPTLLISCKVALKEEKV